MPRHKHCKLCGLDFEPTTAWQDYCSRQCIMDSQRIRQPTTGTMQPQTGTMPIPPAFIMPPVETTGSQQMQCPQCGQPIQPGAFHAHWYTSANR